MKKVLLFAFAFTFSYIGIAQTYTPVSITGFNADVVANGPGLAALSTSIEADGVSYNFVTQDFIGSCGQLPTGGALPNSGTIASAVTTTPGLTFQLGAYTGNNSLRMSGTGTSTLTFATPQAADQVYVLATTCLGTCTVTITVNFIDATTQVFPSVVVSDWYGGTNYAFGGTNRVNRFFDLIDVQATGPRLYQHLLTLSAANAGKTIQSITFNKTTAGGVLNVMGVTIRTVPSTLATDAGITAIAAPNSGCALTSAETITVTVKNHGTAPQINIPVSYKINNGTPVTEYIPSLAPNTSVTHSFATKANLSTLGTYNLEVRTNLTGDLAPTNDVQTRSVVLSTPAVVPAVTVGGPTTLCSGSSVVLTAASITPGATYQWFNNGTAIIGATAATYTASSTGTYTVMAALNGCFSAVSAATAVMVNTAPVAPGINVNGALNICEGDSVMFTAVSTSPGATFTWFKDQTLIPGITSANYAAKDGGFYTASAVVNSCSSPVSVARLVTLMQRPSKPYIIKSGSLLTSDRTTGNQWYKNNVAIPNATTKTYSVTSNGTYTVKVTANGCTSEASNAVTITNTGISDDKNSLQVAVYPNPSAGLFNVALPEGKACQLQVTDLTGEVIQQYTGRVMSMLLDLQGAAKGVYLLKIISEDAIATHKLVIE